MSQCYLCGCVSTVCFGISTFSLRVQCCCRKKCELCYKSNSVKQIFAVIRVEMNQITSRLIKCKICSSRGDFDSFQLLKSFASFHLTTESSNYLLSVSKAIDSCYRQSTNFPEQSQASKARELKI